MTIGIYKLIFPGTDKVYIGQSVNIEDRYRQHCRFMCAGKAAKKLQNAYILYGLPKVEILLVCNREELDVLENEAIEIFDSFNNGFNSVEFSDSAPLLKGAQHGNAKFTKDQILLSATLLQDPNNTFSDISSIIGVSEEMLSKISSGISHVWLSEEEPEIWKNIQNLRNKRTKLGAYRRGDKISAKNTGIIYPKIRSPDGNVYEVENAYAFAREHGLRGNHLTEVLNGHRKSHMGWKVCQEEQV